MTTQTLPRADRSPVSLVAELTWLEFLRRKDIYVISILMGLFILGIVVVRIIGIQDTATSQFLMGLGLNLAYLLAAILVVALSARVMPEDFERGTIMPLLAKPIPRWQALLGRATACIGIAWACYVGFVLLTVLAVWIVPGQNPAVLLQAMLLQMLALAVLGTAALALSLHFPTLVAVLIALGWGIVGGTVVNMFVQATESQITDHLLGILPNLAMLGHLDRFASGGAPLPAGLFISLALYGAAWCAAFYLYGAWRFREVRL